MKEQERAKQMLRIMIDRVKDAKNYEEFTRRKSRCAGAVFILYIIDIITYEEMRMYEDEIFS